MIEKFIVSIALFVVGLLVGFVGGVVVMREEE